MNRTGNAGLSPCCYVRRLVADLENADTNTPRHVRASNKIQNEPAVMSDGVVSIVINVPADMARNTEISVLLTPCSSQNGVSTNSNCPCIVPLRFDGPIRSTQINTASVPPVLPSPSPSPSPSLSPAWDQVSFLSFLYTLHSMPLYSTWLCWMPATLSIPASQVQGIHTIPCPICQRGTRGSM